MTLKEFLAKNREAVADSYMLHPKEWERLIEIIEIQDAAIGLVKDSSEFTQKTEKISQAWIDKLIKEKL